MYLTTQHVSRSASVVEVSAFFIPIVFSITVYGGMGKVSGNRQKGLSCKLTNKMFTKIKAFENKLRLWEFQLHSNNSAHFLALRTKNAY